MFSACRPYRISLRLPGILAACFCAHLNAADAIPGEQYCDRPVSRIVFHGNEDTKRHVLLREAIQKEGINCSLDDVVDSTQAIRNLGLFRWVVAHFSLDERQRLLLHFTVREKYALLVIPRFSRTSDAELRAGVQVRWDNVAGLLHKMRLTSERRTADDGDGNNGYVHKLSYDVPRFLGSDYGMAMGFSVRRQQVGFNQDDIEYGAGHDEMRQFDFLLSRWAGRASGLSGLRYFGGFQVANSDIDIDEGNSGPFVGGTDINIVFGWENAKQQIDTFRRRGEVYGASLRFASVTTHSDFDYVRLDGYWRIYRALKGDTRNVNIQLRLGISDGAPFGRRTYSVGGGEILRGLPPGSATGDILTLANVEYLSAFAGYEQWRWVLFADIGNVYMRDRIRLHEQKLRTGVGIRRKLLSLSNADIRFDVAWDSAANRLRSFFSTSLTF